MGAAWWAVPQPRPLPLSHHRRVRRRRADMCLYSIFELRTTLKDGVESISSSVLRSKTTTAAHIARVRGEEQGTRYLEQTRETQRAYSERAERETLLILYWPVTKQEDIGCILGTAQNICCSQERTKLRNQALVRGCTDPTTSLIGFNN